MMKIVKVHLGVVIVLLWTCSAHAVTYEDVWTEKAGQAYDEDPNVWVYSKEFAARFGMPEAWIDADLKGAYAVAFRVEMFDVRMRLPHKGDNEGMQVRRCIVDMFIKDDVSIPWINDQLSGIRFQTPESPVYLIPQTDEDRMYRSAPIGLGKELQSGVVFVSTKGYGNSLFIHQYNKRIYPGIDFLSFNMACTMPAVEDSQIQFKLIRGVDSPEITHVVDVPKKFMRRLYENWYSRHRNRAEKEYLDILRK